AVSRLAISQPFPLPEIGDLAEVEQMLAPFAPVRQTQRHQARKEIGGLTPGPVRIVMGLERPGQEHEALEDVRLADDAIVVVAACAQHVHGLAGSPWAVVASVRHDPRQRLTPAQASPYSLADEATPRSDRDDLREGTACSD